LTEAETFVKDHGECPCSYFMDALRARKPTVAEDFMRRTTRYKFKDGSFIKVQERRVDIGITP